MTFNRATLRFTSLFLVKASQTQFQVSGYSSGFSLDYEERLISLTPFIFKSLSFSFSNTLQIASIIYLILNLQRESYLVSVGNSNSID